MRYLKSYLESLNEEEQSLELTQTIEDILQPISDIGYNITVKDSRTRDNGQFLIPSLPSKYGTYHIKIRVVRFDKILDMNGPEFTNDIKDEFIRMNTYLESKGFLIEVHIVDSKLYSKEIDFNKFINMDIKLKSLVFIALNKN